MSKIDVLFFHGAGAGAFEADSRLATDLARHLGDDYTVTIPRMPEEDSSGDERWLETIARAIDSAPGRRVLVGHSAGGYVLLKHLADTDIAAEAIAIIAAPFPGGDPDWTFDGFELPEGFGRALGGPVFLYASEDDDIVPFAHRDLYAAAIPGAVTRTTTGGHQLGDDLRLVADDIRAAVEG